MIRHCKTHGAVDHRPRKEGGWRCALCATEAVMKRRRKVKQILVEEGGGACKICGYRKYIGALHFHHLDPSTKSFGVSANGFSRGLDKLRAEAQKCILLCSNCHAEVEAGILIPS